MGTVIHNWFGWPNGAVLTNLVASVIWGIFAWRKLHKMHKHQNLMHKHMLEISRGGVSSENSLRAQERATPTNE